MLPLSRVCLSAPSCSLVLVPCPTATRSGRQPTHQPTAKARSLPRAGAAMMPLRSPYSPPRFPRSAHQLRAEAGPPASRFAPSCLTLCVYSTPYRGARPRAARGGGPPHYGGARRLAPTRRVTEKTPACPSSPTTCRRRLYTTFVSIKEFQK